MTAAWCGIMQAPIQVNMAEKKSYFGGEWVASIHLTFNRR